MTYAVCKLLVPRAVLVEHGMTTGMPDDEGRVYDHRFNTRGATPHQIALDVFNFINEYLTPKPSNDLKETAETVDDISFEVDMTLSRLSPLLKGVKVHVITAIDPMHNEIIDRALSITNNRSAMLSIARNKNIASSPGVREEIDVLKGFVDQLFNEEDPSRHGKLVACMDIVLNRIYKYL